MPQQSGLSAQVGLAAEVYTNEVQTISGTPSAPFTLTFEGATTASLVAAASAAQIQAALEALPNIGTGGVTATGGALPAAVLVTFVGPLVAKRDVGMLSVPAAITGTTITASTPGTGYGSPSTVTRFLEFTKESLKLDQQRIESAGIRAGNTVLRSDRWKVNKKGVKGDLELEVPTKGFGLVLAHVFGKDAVITTPVGGTLTRDQTFTLGDPFNRSLTIQKGVPDTAGGSSNVRAFTEVGCKLTDMELDNDVDGFLNAKLTVDGQDERTDIALATAAYAAAFETLSFIGAQCTVAGANVDARKAGIKLSRGFADSRYFLRGNTKKKEPLLNALADISGDIELEFDSLAHYNRFASSTEAGAMAAITMLWQGALIETTLNYQLLITMPLCRFEGDTPEVDGMDVVAVDYPFKVLWDGTTEPITVVYRSTDTAQ